MKIIVLGLFFVSVISISATSYAATDYQAGDHRKFETQQSGYLKNSDQGKAEPQVFCAPSDSSWYQEGDVKNVKDGDQEINTITVKFDNVAKSGYDECIDQSVVTRHATYTIDISKLATSANTLTGFTMGALIVPFKYIPSAHTTAAGGNIGPYFGWHFSKNADDIKAVISPGAAVVAKDIKQADGSTSASNGQVAAYFAGGLIYSFDKVFEIGIIVGKDWASDYQYNGKTWFAFTLSTPFSN